MVDVLAIAFEGRKHLFATKVEGVCPANVAVLEEKNARICGVVEFFCKRVAEAGVDHEKGIAEVEGVSDSMLVQKDLLLVSAEFL